MSLRKIHNFTFSLLTYAVVLLQAVAVAVAGVGAGAEAGAAHLLHSENKRNG